MLDEESWKRKKAKTSTTEMVDVAAIVIVCPLTSFNTHLFHPSRFPTWLFDAFGQILVDMGFITDDQLQLLIEEQQQQPGILFGKMAEDMGLITEEQLAPGSGRTDEYAGHQFGRCQFGARRSQQDDRIDGPALPSCSGAIRWHNVDRGHVRPSKSNDSG